MDAATSTTTAAPPPAVALELTERAARRIVKIAAGEAPGSALRISVSGGGCSGFQYEFAFTTERNEDDLVVERDGATLLVDALSLEYMAGSRVDFVDSLIGQSFQVVNPQATASCGCGTSFSL
jgi:iron-sulfur cluster assembly accessory protein